ncbi:MAG: hypothetical protein ACOC85_02095 [Thermoplasmatota archaeon]
MKENSSNLIVLVESYLRSECSLEALMIRFQNEGIKDIITKHRDRLEEIDKKRLDELMRVL